MSDANTHAGHRERLRKRYQNEGLTNFEPHEVLELVLYATIPRADTNSIAHALLDRFGSLSGVFDAQAEQLAQVPGMGPQSAQYLKLYVDVCKRYMLDAYKVNHAPEHLNSQMQIAELFYPYFIGARIERLYLLCVDCTNRSLGVTYISEGTSIRTKLDLRKIVDVALHCNAAGVFLCHNHPGGNPFPSQADKALTTTVRDYLNQVGIMLIDHLILAGNKAMFIQHGSAVLEIDLPE